MKHRYHQKHFIGAWKSFWTQKQLWLFGPVIVLVGSTSVVDYMSAALQATLDMTSNRTSDLDEIISTLLHSPVWFQLALLVVAVLIFAIALTAQAAVIHTLYAHGSRKTSHAISHSVHEGFKRLPALFGIQFLGASIIAILITVSATTVNHLLGVWPFWNLVTWIITGAILLACVFFVLSTKLIALNLAVGKKQSAPDAIGNAFQIVKQYPIVILEHNIILFIVYSIGLVVLFAILFLVLTPLAFPMFALILAVPITSSWLILAPAIFVAIIGLISIGILTIFNLSTWAQLTLRLARRPALSSRLVHTLKTYVPLFRKI